MQDVRMQGAARGLRFLKALLARTLKAYQEDNCGQMSAAIAYYVLFSLFPLIIFIVGVAGLFLNERLQREIIDLVLENIPLNQTDGRDTVTEAVEGVAGAAGGTLGVLGLLGMAWSGSALFGVIRRTLNRAFDVERERPLVMQKLFDLALVFGLGVFFLASITATAGLRVSQALSDDIPVAGELAAQLGFGWTLASFVLPLVLSFGAFLFLYTVVPARHVPLKQAWPPALAAALIFELVKNLFGVYIANFGNYDVVFGSLGAVAAFLFWVYISAQVMLFGAEMAAELPRVEVQRYKQPEFDELKLPLRRRLYAALRRLFVREPAPPPPIAERASEPGRRSR